MNIEKLQIVFGDEIAGLSLVRFAKALTKPKKWNGKSIRLLSPKASTLYEALVNKSAESGQRTIVFSIAEGKKAGLTDMTLAIRREELEQRGLIQVRRTKTGYLYELLNPASNERLSMLVKQTYDLGHALKNIPDGKPREYTELETKRVFDFFLGESTDNATESLYTRYYRCPFHRSDDDGFSLVSSAHKNRWQCKNPSCIRHGRSQGYRGGGDLLLFVSAFKFQFDANRGIPQRNSETGEPVIRRLLKGQAREIVAQILDGRAKSIFDLEYTARHDDLNFGAGNNHRVRFHDGMLVTEPRYKGTLLLRQSSVDDHIKSILQSQEAAAA